VECRRTNPFIKGEYLFSTATFCGEINKNFEIDLESDNDDIIDEEYFDVKMEDEKLENEFELDEEDEEAMKKFEEEIELHNIRGGQEEGSITNCYKEEEGLQ
jgi:hypothetical protein